MTQQMDSDTAPGTAPDTDRTAAAADDAGWPAETMAGGILVGLTVVGAIFFRYHPGQIFLDRWGFSFVHPALGNSLYRHVVQLKSLPYLVAGSILAALVVVGRDRLRALACLVGPLAAVLVAEWFLKPVIARRYAEVLTYPSGTTTAVAGVVTAWAVAVPRQIRAVVVVVGAFLVGLECIAVVGLQWHYPTDALAGAALGAGIVLLLDGLLHLLFARERGAADAPHDAPDPSAPTASS